MKQLSITTFIIVGAIISAVAFLAGTKYKESQRQGFFGQTGNRQFMGRQPGLTGGRPVTGEIITADNKSVTVKLQDGISKIIILTDQTAISKSTQGSKTDLKQGEKIVVFGSQNSDGSITAQNVQLNPLFKGLPTGGPPGK